MSLGSESALILRLLAVSVTCAKRAGVLTRQIMSSGQLGIVEKGANDLQTEADRTAQRAIIHGLRQHFKNVRIVGEEEEATEGEEAPPKDSLAVDLDSGVLKEKCPSEWSGLEEQDLTVWVDPLDGTSEFTQGLLDHVTVLIGVSHASRAIAGVLLQPYWHPNLAPDLPVDERKSLLMSADCGQRCIWALKHLGIRGIQARPPPPVTEQRPWIVTTTRSHSDPHIEQALLACQPCQIERVGGCGHKVLMLVEGEAHVYVFPTRGCKKWDTCAPEALLEAAGGVLRDGDGGFIDYPESNDREAFNNSRGVLAALNVSLFGSLMAKLRPV